MQTVPRLQQGTTARVMFPTGSWIQHVDCEDGWGHAQCINVVCDLVDGGSLTPLLIATHLRYPTPPPALTSDTELCFQARGRQHREGNTTLCSVNHCLGRMYRIHQSIDIVYWMCECAHNRHCSATLQCKSRDPGARCERSRVQGFDCSHVQCTPTSALSEGRV